MQNNTLRVVNKELEFAKEVAAREIKQLEKHGIKPDQRKVLDIMVASIQFYKERVDNR